jgi:hypothetical protein
MGGEENFQAEEAFLSWQQDRARRVEKNEQEFRGYNERRDRFEREASTEDDDPAPFVCECADRECRAVISLTLPEFEGAHSEHDRYTVMPGHVLPEFETVIEEHTEYWVVKKFRPEEVAQRLVTAADGQQSPRG